MEKFTNWIEQLTNEELVTEINRLDFWDGDLLEELVSRAFPDYEPEDEDEHWQCGDQICYDAAKELGYQLVESFEEPNDGIRRLVDTSTHHIVRRILANHSLSLDEAINLVGMIHSENELENVEIDGKLYYYDDLALV